MKDISIFPLVIILLILITSTFYNALNCLEKIDIGHSKNFKS